MERTSHPPGEYSPILRFVKSTNVGGHGTAQSNTSYTCTRDGDGDCSIQTSHRRDHYVLYPHDPNRGRKYNFFLTPTVIIQARHQRPPQNDRRQNPCSHMSYHRYRVGALVGQGSCQDMQCIQSFCSIVPC